MRVDRRAFLGSLAGAAGAAACRTAERGQLVLRLSHSMTAGRTSLHIIAERFRDLVSAATSGAVIVRLFPSGTLGQERETVQQLQEGLIDFMISGTAIWGSVAPKLQVFDFPFLWRDWPHVHGVVDGWVGREAAEYMSAAVRVRPIAWGDSFGFRQVITRTRAVTTARDLAGLKLRTIQSPIYVRAVELMGASPTPMAFGEVYTSMQTGVVDGYEHDASTTYQMHFYEVARHLTRTRHIAGLLGLWASTRTLATLTPELRDIIQRAALEAAAAQRAVGDAEDAHALDELRKLGMTIHEFDASPFRPAAARLWAEQAQALGTTGWMQAINA